MPPLVMTVNPWGPQFGPQFGPSISGGSTTGGSTGTSGALVMPFDNYTDLQSTVLTWIARPGDTFLTGSVPDMITLFEAHARRELYTDPQEITTTLTTVAGQSTLPLPVSFGEWRELVLIASELHTLDYLTPEQMDSVWVGSQMDAPKVFTVEGANFRFAPIPDSAYQITLDYIQGLQGLSATNASNWLLANHPDGYLFGALAEAELFIGNDERMPMWLQRRDTTIGAIQLADRKLRWGSSTLTMRTDTGNP